MVHNKAAHDSAHGNGVVLVSPDILDLEDLFKMRWNRHIARPLMYTPSKRKQNHSLEVQQKDGELNARTGMAIYLRGPPGSTLHKSF